MYEVLTLNKIAKCGLDNLDKNLFSLTDEINNPDAIILRSFKMHDMELFDNLKCIARAGAGVNNIPIEKCSEKGIVVFNTPGANANAVAELTVAGLMLASRKIAEAIIWTNKLKEEADNVESLVEKGKSAFAGPEIYGKKLGVIGLGAIGAKVANLGVALGMEVMGYDPYISVESAWGISSNVKKCADLKILCANCDYISIHLPLNDATRGIVNDEIFECMEKGTRLLNFSRGELVDTEALKKAIENSTIVSYVVDFPSQETLKMKNVVNIPHLGASTPESEDNCAVMAVKELSEFMKYGNIKNSVNFPDIELPMETKYRVTIAHKNIPNMLTKFSAIFANNNINIVNLLNKSKKDNAYTIIDADTIPEGLSKEIEIIDGVYKVRIIEA